MRVGVTAARNAKRKTGSSDCLGQPAGFHCDDGASTTHIAITIDGGLHACAWAAAIRFYSLTSKEILSID